MQQIFCRDAVCTGSLAGDHRVVALMRSPKIMVDLHCHILPGLDDGPVSMDESMAMAESAIADGITHVVATPHANSIYAFDFDRVRRLRNELQELVGERLELATGCDFHMDPENLAALKEDAPRFCLNQRDYLLVEFNEISIPPPLDQTLHHLRLATCRPLTTHPHPNALLRVQPERLAKWLRLGCYAQVACPFLTSGFVTPRHVPPHPSAASA